MLWLGSVMWKHPVALVGGGKLCSGAWKLGPGGCLNIKMPSYQYRNSHYKDKTVWWLIVTMEIPIPGRLVFIFGNGAQMATWGCSPYEYIPLSVQNGSYSVETGPRWPRGAVLPMSTYHFQARRAHILWRRGPDGHVGLFSPWVHNTFRSEGLIFCGDGAQMATWGCSPHEYIPLSGQKGSYSVETGSRWPRGAVLPMSTYHFQVRRAHILWRRGPDGHVGLFSLWVHTTFRPEGFIFCGDGAQMATWGCSPYEYIPLSGQKGSYSVETGPRWPHGAVLPMSTYHFQSRRAHILWRRGPDGHAGLFSLWVHTTFSPEGLIFCGDGAQMATWGCSPYEYLPLSVQKGSYSVETGPRWPSGAVLPMSTYHFQVRRVHILWRRGPDGHVGLFSLWVHTTFSPEGLIFC